MKQLLQSLSNGKTLLQEVQAQNKNGNILIKLGKRPYLLEQNVCRLSSESLMHL